MGSITSPGAQPQRRRKVHPKGFWYWRDSEAQNNAWRNVRQYSIRILLSLKRANADGEGVPREPKRGSWHAFLLSIISNTDTHQVGTHKSKLK